MADLKVTLKYYVPRGKYSMAEVVRNFSAETLSLAKMYADYICREEGALDITLTVEGTFTKTFTKKDCVHQQWYERLPMHGIIRYTRKDGKKGITTWDGYNLRHLKSTVTRAMKDKGWVYVQLSTKEGTYHKTKPNQNWVVEWEYNYDEQSG